MKSIYTLLAVAKALYALAPSHAPAGERVEEGCHCLISGIWEAGRGEGYDINQRVQAECVVLNEIIRRGGGVGGLVSYNASHSTEEVIDVLDAAMRSVGV